MYRLTVCTVLLSSLKHAVAQRYDLVQTYSPDNFFDEFQFFSGPDPTGGFVQYVPYETAVSAGLASNVSDSVYLGVDYTNKYPPGGPGRPSVRLESKSTFTEGLFVLELSHIPTGCGIWPAFWTVGLGDWPADGEIDIIENVNDATANNAALHAAGDCAVSGAVDQTGTGTSTDCNIAHNGNQGCATEITEPGSFGDTFNQNGGGYYAMEWTNSTINIWFFNIDSVPDSLYYDESYDPLTSHPDTSTFGTPSASFAGPCSSSFGDKFFNHTIVIDTDFCGGWAGSTFGTGGSSCPALAGADPVASCVDFVGNNPEAFQNAFWALNSLRVWQRNAVIIDKKPFPTNGTASNKTLPLIVGVNTPPEVAAPVSVSPLTGGVLTSPDVVPEATPFPINQDTDYSTGSNTLPLLPVSPLSAPLDGNTGFFPPALSLPVPSPPLPVSPFALPLVDATGQNGGPLPALPAADESTGILPPSVPAFPVSNGDIGVVPPGLIPSKNSLLSGLSPDVKNKLFALAKAAGAAVPSAPLNVSNIPVTPSLPFAAPPAPILGTQSANQVVGGVSELDSTIPTAAGLARREVAAGSSTNEIIPDTALPVGLDGEPDLSKIASIPAPLQEVAPNTPVSAGLAPAPVAALVPDLPLSEQFAGFAVPVDPSVLDSSPAGLVSNGLPIPSVPAVGDVGDLPSILSAPALSNTADPGSLEVPVDAINTADTSKAVGSILGVLDESTRNALLSMLVPVVIDAITPDDEGVAATTPDLPLAANHSTFDTLTVPVSEASAASPSSALPVATATNQTIVARTEERGDLDDSNDNDPIRDGCSRPMNPVSSYAPVGSLPWVKRFVRDYILFNQVFQSLDDDQKEELTDLLATGAHSISMTDSGRLLEKRQGRSNFDNIIESIAKATTSDTNSQSRSEKAPKPQSLKSSQPSPSWRPRGSYESYLVRRVAGADIERNLPDSSESIWSPESIPESAEKTHPVFIDTTDNTTNPLLPTTWDQVFASMNSTDAAKLRQFLDLFTSFQGKMPSSDGDISTYVRYITGWQKTWSTFDDDTKALVTSLIAQGVPVPADAAKMRRPEERWGSLQRGKGRVMEKAEAQQRSTSATKSRRQLEGLEDLDALDDDSHIPDSIENISDGLNDDGHIPDDVLDLSGSWNDLQKLLENYINEQHPDKKDFTPDEIAYLFPPPGYVDDYWGEEGSEIET